jgi:Ribbon-helix-helix protein, copG family
MSTPPIKGETFTYTSRRGADMTASENRRRFSITLSVKTAKAFDWLKQRTDANTDSEVIRNALRLHYVLLLCAENGETFYIRDKDGEQRQIVLFTAADENE